MVHFEDTPVADRAVMGAYRLDFFTVLAVAAPKLLEIVCGLATVHEQTLHLRVDTFKPFVVVIERQCS
jgi:hypothetical protein